MNKKKLLTMVLALVLIGAVGVGATLAYFTDNDSATNIVTMGHVDVELTEPGFDTEDGTADNTISDVTPGQVIAKDPTITLAADSLDAYVRVKLTVDGLDETATAEVLDALDIQDGWTLVDGYYYYADALTQESKTATLFTKVTIPYEWNNDYAEAEFTIDVAVEAIQADNLADDFFNENGSWNIDAEKIIEYTEQQ